MRSFLLLSDFLKNWQPPLNIELILLSCFFTCFLNIKRIYTTFLTAKSSWGVQRPGSHTPEGRTAQGRWCDSPHSQTEGVDLPLVMCAARGSLCGLGHPASGGAHENACPALSSFGAKGQVQGAILEGGL